jgi:hypothetical protein
LDGLFFKRKIEKTAMLDILVIIFGGILVLLGVAGSLLPVLPGPPLSFMGLLLLALVRGFAPPLTPTLMGIMIVLTILSAVADHLLPLLGAKRYGASKWGLWGSVAGMIIGMFFSPLGLILGAMAGALVVELMMQKEKEAAFRASWGILVGTLVGLGLKLGLSGIMAYYFLRGLSS